MKILRCAKLAFIDLCDGLGLNSSLTAGKILNAVWGGIKGIAATILFFLPVVLIFYICLVCFNASLLAFLVCPVLVMAYIALAFQFIANFTRYYADEDWKQR